MKKTLKLIFLIILVLILIGSACLFYGFKLEPFMLKVEEYQLTNVNIDNLKIVHISDLHIKPEYGEERLGRIVDEVNNQDPDLVFFTGDLFDNYSKYGDENKVVEYLSQIESNYGKFAVWGNHDYGGGGKNVYPETMEKSGFTLLTNEREYVEVQDSRISIYGLDEDMLGSPKYASPKKEYDYEILLMHEQKYFSENRFNVDLALSGHTHGGQVNIPLIDEGSILKRVNPSLVNNYIKGFYSTENGKLFVNSGIGTTIMTARFNVKPEISVINISKP